MAKNDARTRAQRACQTRRERHRALITNAMQTEGPEAATDRAWDLYRAERSACVNTAEAAEIAMEVIKYLTDISARFRGGKA
jgi:hypothetical protein